MHFRGPIHLSNVAVYTPGKGKRDAPKATHAKRHGHQHLHKKHNEQKEERAVGDVVVATIDGQAVSWINTYAGPTADAAADASPAAVTASPAYPVDSPAAKSPAAGNHQKTHVDKTPITGDFVRSAYYDATSGVADGLVFLANVGSPGVSGTWDT